VGAGSSIAGVVLGLIACSVAAAEPAGSYRDAREAAVQFERGRALFKDARYVEACAAFARSQQLDPQSGTLYNAAGCYSQRGLLVSAWNAYRDLASHDRNPRRRADAARRAKAIEARIPKLRITAPAPGWTVSLNGVDVSGVLDLERPVDPGIYEVIGSVGGHPRFRTTVTIVADGKTMNVAIRPQPGELADPFGIRPPAELAIAVVTPHPAPLDPEQARARLYARITTIAGGSLLATGLVFGKLASDQFTAAHRLCGEPACMDPTELARHDSLVDRGRARAHAATAFVVTGAAVTGTGIWLLWRAARSDKQPAIRVAPGSGPALAGLTLAGQF
jgi:tetratricopeptide (TPR) repeat protein